MSIAITADVHLKESRDATPERYEALVAIFRQLANEGIANLIIAGDLFDRSSTNYSLFDDLCKAYPTIQVFVIPGNHDPSLKPAAFEADNLTVITETQLISLADGKLECLFCPYQAHQTMGEALAAFEAKAALPTDTPWLLIGHGDYLGSRKVPGSDEPGIYMPLSASDIDHYQPNKVLLGHIHQRSANGLVHYPGSPCGLDITETGKRYFSLLDPDSLAITAQPVDTRTIYYNETLVSLPLPDEAAYIREQIQSMHKRWDLSEADFNRVSLRLTVKGFTQDKSMLKQTIMETLHAVHWYDGEPDLSQVHVNPDPFKQELVETLRRRIEEQADTLANLNLSQQEVLEKAMHRILNP